MAKPTLLLDAHLKALRLPTFLREYDKVARQCAQEGLDCSRYLFRLCELELLDREQRAVERRIKASLRTRRPTARRGNSWRDGFARDCPLRHPVLPMLALRDRSAFAPDFLVEFWAFSAVSGRAPGRRDAAGATWRPVWGGTSREPVSMVRIGPQHAPMCRL